jgi:hypothetical protein
VVQHVPAASNVQIRDLRDDHTTSIACAPYPGIKTGLVQPGHSPMAEPRHDVPRPSDKR